jgi:hypothetical protein
MKRSFVRAVIGAIFLVALFVPTRIARQSTVRRVPADYPTIQQAINACLAGDSVLVAPGTYLENIDFLGKAITVYSEGGPQVTIIDGHQAESVVRFITGETRASKLDGFTLRHGNGLGGYGEGGGIFVNLSSPTIANNLIMDNSASTFGGGISVEAGAPLITGNTVDNNRSSFGAGICARGGSSIIDGNTITNNSEAFGCCAFGGGVFLGGDQSTQLLNNIISNNRHSEGGGIALFASGPVLIRGNTIRANRALRGGGISTINDSSALIIGNLIVDNAASAGGGLYYLWPPGAIVNNTFANNDGLRGSGIDSAAAFGVPVPMFNNIIVAKQGQTAFYCEDSFTAQNAPILRSNNIFAPGGTAYGGFCPDKTGMNGNISADPLFVNASAGDYHLRALSPCIDAGDNSAPHLTLTDLEGKPRIHDGTGDGIAVVDMGAYEDTASFDICVQDDSNGSLLRLNSTTGEYQFTNCSSFNASGTGSVIKRGGSITLQHYAADRRVLARIDAAVSRGAATVQILSLQAIFTITDRNTANNTCNCTAR